MCAFCHHTEEIPVSRSWPCAASCAVEEGQNADSVYYPYVMVNCHPANLTAEGVLHHPRVIVEVLSKSTAA